MTPSTGWGRPIVSADKRKGKGGDSHHRFLGQQGHAESGGRCASCSTYAPSMGKSMPCRRWNGRSYLLTWPLMGCNLRSSRFLQEPLASRYRRSGSNVSIVSHAHHPTLRQPHLHTQLSSFDSCNVSSWSSPDDNHIVRLRCGRQEPRTVDAGVAEGGGGGSEGSESIRGLFDAARGGIGTKRSVPDLTVDF